MTYIQAGREGIQTDRQSNIQADKHPGLHTVIQTYIHTYIKAGIQADRLAFIHDIQKLIYTEVQADIHAYRQTDWQTGGLADKAERRT